jgi:CheY-like chemotaxis protein
MMAAKRTPATAPRGRAGRPRIAWAEDSVHDQILIKESLGGVLADVAFAADGLHLLEAVQETRPDLVVLDLRMPRLGGLETLRRLRAEPMTRELAVCVFSAGDQPDEVAACRALGALEVVQKPVDFDQYMKAVRRITSRVA